MHTAQTQKLLFFPTLLLRHPRQHYLTEGRLTQRENGHTKAKLSSVKPAYEWTESLHMYEQLTK
jgi:hypothetical protein